VTERLTRQLTWLLDRAERLLPPSRRPWVEAILAETEQVPAGRQQLSWIIGGLWLVVKEANVARKLGYWLGVGGIAAIAAWTAWLSLRTASGSDAEAVTDRFRVLVPLTALIGLPWLARRQGAFGPVAPGVAARFARIAGCATICGLGAILVHLDAHGQNAIGSGGFNPVQEFTGLAALAATVVAPVIVKARWPQAGPEVPWTVAACGAATAMVLVPLQLIAVAYLALILAATSRRSPVRPATLVVGLAGGLISSLIIYALPDLFDGDGWWLVWLVLLAALICTVLAGAGAAWLVRDTGTADELWSARVRQGMFAGITAGAVGGLVPTLFLLIFAVVMVLGPLAGVLGGRFGGALAAGRLRKQRPDRSISVGLFVSD
jgi:hypothetical protein